MSYNFIGPLYLSKADFFFLKKRRTFRSSKCPTWYYGWWVNGPTKGRGRIGWVWFISISQKMKFISLSSKSYPWPKDTVHHHNWLALFYSGSNNHCVGNTQQNELPFSALTKSNKFQKKKMIISVKQNQQISPTREVSSKNTHTEKWKF